MLKTEEARRVAKSASNLNRLNGTNLQLHNYRLSISVPLEIDSLLAKDFFSKQPEENQCRYLKKKKLPKFNAISKIKSPTERRKSGNCVYNTDKQSVAPFRAVKPSP